MCNNSRSGGGKPKQYCMVVLVRVLVSNGSGGSCDGDAIFAIGGRVNTDISGKKQYY